MLKSSTRRVGAGVGAAATMIGVTGVLGVASPAGASTVPYVLPTTPAQSILSATDTASGRVICLQAPPQNHLVMQMKVYNQGAATDYGTHGPGCFGGYSSASDATVTLIWTNPQTGLGYTDVKWTVKAGSTTNTTTTFRDCNAGGCSS